MKAMDRHYIVNKETHLAVCQVPDLVQIVDFVYQRHIIV